MIKSEICFYDGFKIKIVDNDFTEALLNRKQELALEARVNAWGEIVLWKAIYRRIRICIKKDNKTDRLVTTLAGSFHYIANGNSHNADVLTFIRFQKAVSDLARWFNIPLEKALLINLEIGFNVFLDGTGMSGNEIIRNILFLSKKPVNAGRTLSEYPKTGAMYCAEHTQFYLKSYCKSCQHIEVAKGETIARFELKMVKSRMIKKLGFETIVDLLNVDNHNKAAKRVRWYFRNLIIHQKELLAATLTKEEDRFLRQDCHFSNLEMLSGREFVKVRDRYLCLVNKYCTCNTTVEVIKKVDEYLQ